MIKLLKGIILSFLALLITGLPVLAVASYQVTFIVTSTAAKSETPIILSNNNTLLVDNHFINSTGNDTAILQGGTSIPHMIADNKTLFAAPTLSIGTNSFQYLSGQTQADFPIIVGNNGYITVNDNVALEPGSSNLTYTWKGMFDTTAGSSKYLINKPDAISAYISPTVSGNITATIVNTAASDTLHLSADSENTTASTSYVVLKSITLTSDLTNARVKFDIKSSTGGIAVWGKVYKNGIAIGTEQSTTSSVYSTKSADIALNAASGDAIQVYGKATSGETCYIENFRIYYTDNSPTITATGVTSAEHTVIISNTNTPSGNTIDVGLAATDRAGAQGALYTEINLSNSANDTGIINSVEVWATTDITGFRVGTFYLTGGTDYKCRDSEAIGNIASGSKQTFAVNIDVQTGDFIGYYDATGTIDADATGGNLAYLSGEHIDPADTGTYTITNVGFSDISLYGTGVASGGIQFSMTIDGSLAATTTGVAIPDNANAWVFNQGNVMPYANYITENISGVQKLWFQPNDIVHEPSPTTGTLIDRMGNQNGVITWGANSGDLTMGALASFTPTVTPPLAQINAAINPDVLPTMNPSTSATPTAPTNPLSPLADIWAFLWGFTSSVMWFLIAVLCIILTFIGTAITFQHVGWAGIAACLVAGLFSVFHVIPMGFIFVDIVGIIAFAILEAKA